MMQTGDFRNLFDPAMPQPHRFTPGDPAPLLFIESIQQRMELLMPISSGIVLPRLTDHTTTAMTRLPCHLAPTFP